MTEATLARQLETTPTHEALAALISELPVNWERLTDEFTDRRKRRFGSGVTNETLHFSQLPGHFAEQHLYHCLEAFAKQNPSVVQDLTPIDHLNATRFCKRRRGGVVVYKGKNTEVREYDDLRTIDKVPTIVEVKNTLDHLRVLGCIKADVITQRIDPLVKALGTNPNQKIAYMLVAPADYPSTCPEFRERGGIVAPMNKPHLDFITHSAHIALRFNLFEPEVQVPFLARKAPAQAA